MRAATVDVLMITHRRPHYTELSLERLLETADGSARIWVWHNGDDAETLSVVKRFADHPRLHRLHISPQNVGLTEPTNWLWLNSEGEYVGKVDDDCLVPDGWISRLRDAHDANPEIGVLGLWLYLEEDFIPELAQRKIEPLDGGCQILRHPWVQGSGYLMKRECIDAQGVLSDGQSFTDYCIALAQRGWSNGFHFPFIYEDHMDDPRSPNTMLRSNADMERYLPLSARNSRIDDLSEWEDHIRFGGFLLQYWPPDAEPLGGLRGRFRRDWAKLMYARWKRRRSARRSDDSSHVEVNDPTSG
jgi:glycosyltransferase involved in cell wall biosynthesis